MGEEMTKAERDEGEVKEKRYCGGRVISFVHSARTMCLHMFGHLACLSCLTMDATPLDTLHHQFSSLRTPYDSHVVCNTKIYSNILHIEIDHIKHVKSFKPALPSSRSNWPPLWTLPCSPRNQ